MTQWYVLQVLTGQEEDVQQELERHGYETLLLREMRTIRQRGSWREQEYLLMPGYLFVRLELTDEAYYLLNGTAGVIRILSTGGRPAARRARGRLAANSRGAAGTALHDPVL